MLYAFYSFFSYDTSLKLLEKWLMSNSTFIPLLQTPLNSISKELLVQYYVLEFLNVQLTRINGNECCFSFFFNSVFLKLDV